MTLLTLLALLAGSSPPAATEVAGHAAAGPCGLYVEARTASVYAGACHYNSELVTAGAEALLAWSFEGGAREGVDLAGTRVAAVVVADRNFALAGARSTSVLYVDGPHPAARAAAVAEVRERHRGVLGRVRSLARADLGIEGEGERYAVSIPGVARLEGLLMPDRACCTMPQARWYDPFSDVQSSIVGRSTRFEHTAGRWVERRWIRKGQNDAQVGRFAW